MVYFQVIKKMLDLLKEEFPEQAEKIEEIADKAIDWVEDKIEKSPNKIDDMILLPLIKKFIREPLGIEDND